MNVNQNQNHKPGTSNNKNETNTVSVNDKDKPIVGTNVGPYKVGLSPDQVMEYYNNWTSYDQELTAKSYTGPRVVAEAANRQLAGKYDSKILDVGAGSGKIAYELSCYGFKVMDALEPSEQFLANSEYRQLYQDCYHVFLGKDTTHVINDDNYDAIVVSGAFGEGHVPCKGLDDMIRMVKPGGLIIIAIREEYIYNVKEYTDRLEPYMTELEAKGKWRLVERSTIDNFAFNRTGVLFVFKVNEIGFNEFRSEILKK